MNCTNNNTCYSTNNQSNTPNSKLESDYLALCNFGTANTATNEFVDPLNKLNSVHLNKNLTCFTKFNLNNALNRSLKSSIQNNLHYLHNHNLDEKKNRIESNLQDNLKHPKHYVKNNLKPVISENDLNVQTKCRQQIRTSVNYVPTNLTSKLNKHLNEHLDDHLDNYSDNHFDNHLNNNLHLNLKNKNQITNILDFVKTIYSFIQFLRTYLTISTRLIIDQQLIKYFTSQTNQIVTLNEQQLRTNKSRRL